MYKQYYEHLHEYITNILYSDHRSLFLRIALPEGEEEDDQEERQREREREEEEDQQVEVQYDEDEV